MPINRIDICVLPLTNTKNLIQNNIDLFNDTRDDLHESYWCRRTFQVETPSTVHIFFDEPDFAREVLERLRLTGVYEKIELVESSELTRNFTGQRVRDAVGDVSDLCRVVDLPQQPNQIQNQKETEGNRRNKRKRETMLDAEDLRDGSKRYRKKRKSIKLPKKKKMDPLVVAMARTKYQQTIAHLKRKELLTDPAMHEELMNLYHQYKQTSPSVYIRE